VKVSAVFSLTVLSGRAASTGGLLASLTTTTTFFTSLAQPSLTRTLMRLVVLFCRGVGVQVKTPVAGSIAAPAGAPGSRLKVSGLAGRSGSVATAAKVKGRVGRMRWLGIAASAGGVLTSRTVIVTPWLALRAGEPSSVARTVII